MKTKIKDFISRHDTMLLCILLAVLFILATSIPVHAYTGYTGTFYIGQISQSTLNGNNYFAYGTATNNSGEPIFVFVDLGTSSSRSIGTFSTSGNNYVASTTSNSTYPYLVIAEVSGRFAMWESSSNYSNAKFSTSNDYGINLTSITWTYNGKKSASVTWDAYQSFIAANTTPTVSSITATKTQTYYYVGDSVAYDDITVTATWSDGSTTTPGTWVHSNVDTSTTGTKQLMITFEGKTATIDITVSPPLSNAYDHCVLGVNSTDFFIYRFKNDNEFALGLDGSFNVDSGIDFYYDSVQFVDYNEIITGSPIYHNSSGYTLSSFQYLYQGTFESVCSALGDIGLRGIFNHWDYHPCILQKSGTNYLVLNDRALVNEFTETITGDIYIYTFSNNPFTLNEFAHYTDGSINIVNLGYNLLNDSNLDDENDALGIGSHLKYLIEHPTYTDTGGGSTEPGSTDPGTTEVNIDMTGLEARIDRMLLLFGLCIVWFVGTGISKKVGDF